MGQDLTNLPGKGLALDLTIISLSTQDLKIPQDGALWALSLCPLQGFLPSCGHEQISVCPCCLFFLLL
jgi:hypothetical protein